MKDAIRTATENLDKEHRRETEQNHWNRVLMDKQDREDISRNWSRDSEDIWQKEHVSAY